MRSLMLLLILCLSYLNSNAQDSTINRLSISGDKTGHWIYLGKDRPEMNYPYEGKIEEGNYVNNRKEGIWIKYYPDGTTPKLKGEYRNNRPNGNYWKYFPDGTLKEEGTFQKGLYIDLLTRKSTNGSTYLRALYDENGECLVDSFFYYNTVECFDYIEVVDYTTDSVDLITYSKDSCNVKISQTRETRYRITGCGNTPLRSPLTYARNDTTIEAVNPVINNSEFAPQSYFHLDTARIKGTKGFIIESIIDTDSTISYNEHIVQLKSGSFIKHGPLHLYNGNDEIFIKGEFQNNRLMEGKVYLYDEDGILLKVKVYKKGEYHSDGQL